MICIQCQELFEVYTNVGTPLAYCPCCGHEFTSGDLYEIRKDDDDEDD